MKEVLSLIILIILIIKQSLSVQILYSSSDFLEFAEEELVNYQQNPLNNTNPSVSKIVQIKQNYLNPTIFIAVSQIDIDTRSTYVGFFAKGSILNKQQVKLQIAQTQDSMISNMRLHYIVFENQNLISQVDCIDYVVGDSALISIKSYSFANQFLVQQQKPSVSVFLTGFQCDQNSNSLSIFLEPNILENDFEIKITRSHAGFSKICYSILQIFPELPSTEQPQLSNYNNVQQIVDQSHILIPSSNILSQEKDESRFSSEILIDFTKNFEVLPSDIYLANIFHGITSIDFNIQKLIYGLRLSLADYVVSQTKFSFKYRVWSNSRLNGVATTFLSFKMVNCASSFPSDYIYNDSKLSKCLLKCNQSNYIELDNQRQTKKCIQCHVSCKECNGFLQNNCTQCFESFYLSNQKECLVCPSQCQSCLSQNQCIKCNSSFQYMYKDMCYSSSPPNTFCHPFTHVCSDCPSQCKGCDINSNCLACSNQQEYLYEGQCLQTPPPESYCNTFRICTKCPSECKTCNMNLQCLQCINTTDFLFQGKCLQTPPDYVYCIDITKQNLVQFLDIIKLSSKSQNTFDLSTYHPIQCFYCNQQCQKCKGPTKNDCLSCQSGFILENNTCYCEGKGQAYNPLNDKCENCLAEKCVQCRNSINSCEKCELNFQYDPGLNKCVCSDSLMYYDNYYQTCLKNTIKNCLISDKLTNKCQKCEEGYQRNSDGKTCSYCGGGKYTDSNNQCLNNCQKDCLLCINSFKCDQQKPQVPENPNENNNNNNYQGNCHFSCNQCKGNSIYDCIACSSSTRLYVKEKSLCECRPGLSDYKLAECLDIDDIDQKYFKISQGLFVISLVVQLPFVLLIHKPVINYMVNIQQIIGLLTLSLNLQADLPSFTTSTVNLQNNVRNQIQENKITQTSVILNPMSQQLGSQSQKRLGRLLSEKDIQYFQLSNYHTQLNYYYYTNFFNISEYFFQSNYLLPQFSYSLILISSILILALFIKLAIHISKPQPNQLTNFFSTFFPIQLFTITSLTAYFSITYLSKQFSKFSYLQYISGSIALAISIIFLIYLIHLSIKASRFQNFPQKSSLLDNSMQYFSQILINQVNQNEDSESTVIISKEINAQNRLNSFIWVILEIRKILSSIILIYFEQLKYKYVIICGMSVILLITIVICKTFNSRLSNIQVILAELLLIQILTIFTKVSQDFQNSSTLLVYLSIALILLQVFITFSILSYFLKYIYQRFKNNSSSNKTQETSSLQQIPQFVRQDQIDNILKSALQKQSSIRKAAFNISMKN